MPVKASMISFAHSCLPVSKGFQKCLAQTLNQHHEDLANHITLNFRDKNYSATNGGFHPVEIALQKMEGTHYSILYITDFSYCGGPYPELERDVDFDIGNGMAFSRYGGWQSIREPLMAELYELWQSNFVAYVDMDAYDEIKVSSH
ncbi:hypothetical protein ST37_14080 [Vibrio sp. qd031]|uniref:DUF2787 domain-containing protein n=1 Tax=Vibrio sp. qd031 TaxID=1603038 RepID=UPI000A0F6B25|nr:DUF2787 domain-containing protein [Vibrio sp. qd031]ORT49520.1 hypothetical protein ST37_14080 [Vibrio sp. qd031]